MNPQTPIMQFSNLVYTVTYKQLEKLYHFKYYLITFHGVIPASYKSI